MKNFDLDWWGVSHKSSLDFILKNDDSDKIKVYARGFTNLRDTYLYLNEADKSRIVLTMQELEGRSIKEISELTGWSVSLVKVQAFRARKEMRIAVERFLKKEENL